MLCAGSGAAVVIACAPSAASAAAPLRTISMRTMELASRWVKNSLAVAARHLTTEHLNFSAVFNHFAASSSPRKPEA